MLNNWQRRLRKVRREARDVPWRKVLPRIALAVGALLGLSVALVGAGGRPDNRLQKGQPAVSPVAAPDPQVTRLEKQVQRNPSSSRVRSELGNAYLKQSELAGALGQFSQALQIDEQKDSQGKDAPGESALGLAQVATEVRDRDGALVFAERAARRKPNDPDAWTSLGIAYAMNRRNADGTRIFEQSLKQFPKHRKLKLAAAAHFGRLRQWARAESLARAAAALPPQDGAADGLLVALFLEQGRIQDGEAQLVKLSRDRPNDPNPVFALGKVRLGQRDLTGAREAFEQVGRMQPGEPVPHVYAAITYMLDSNLDSAEASYRKALAVDTNSASAQLGIATIRHLQGRKPEAIESYERLAQSQPSLSPALNNLAYLYAEEGKNLDRAQQLAERAVAVSPRTGSLHDTLGWVLYRRGEHTAAVAELQQASRLAPQNGTIQFHLGKALLAAGKQAPGEAALRKALTLSLGYREKEEAERILGGAAAQPNQTE